MRRAQLAIFSVILILSLVVAASAHPGRTDANGGHHVSATGEYHYHHGYPPHQHTNGICPYDYVDNEEHNSTSQTTTNRGAISESESVQKEEINVGKADADKVDWKIWAALVILSVSDFVFFKLWRYEKKQSAVTKEQCAAEIMAAKKRYDIERATVELEKINERKRKKDFRIKRIELIEKYNGKSARELFLIPRGLELDESNIPRIRGGGPGSLIVAVSPTGVKYHRIGCNPNANKYVHLSTVWKSKEPCSKCDPPRASFEWYEEFCKTNTMLSHYGISLTVKDDIIHVVKLNRPKDEQ